MNLTKAKIQNHIALIRNSAAVFLIDTAQHKKRIGETVVDGQPFIEYDDPVDINVRLITRSGSARGNIAAQGRVIEQEVFTGLYRMQVAYEADISEGDQIVITDANTGEEKTLDVTYAPPRHEYTGAVVIQLQEVK